MDKKILSKIRNRSPLLAEMLEKLGPKRTRKVMRVRAKLKQAAMNNKAST